jgi:signal peptidase I
MADSLDQQTTSQPDQGNLGRWLRIAVIGRNPRITLARIVALVVTCTIVFKFILLPIRVDGISMFPTYKNGSINFVNRFAYSGHEPRRGDVVSIRLGQSSNPYHAPSVMYMKRIVGLPGESISWVNGRLLINGTPISEPYLKGICDWNANPIQIATNQYFVVGDNRTMPWEYHYKGRVFRRQIVGKVLF